RPRLLMDGDLIEVGTTLMRYGGPAREPAPAPPPEATPPSEVPGPQATTDELPSLPEGTPAAAGEPPARRARLDAALLLLGVALALAGVLVTWSFSREAAPARRDPPAAPSSAGAARRSW